VEIEYSLGERIMWKRSQAKATKGAGKGPSDSPVTSNDMVAEILVGNLAGYLDLVESSDNLIVSLTPGGLIYYVNPKWLELLQYEVSEAKDLPFLDIVHPSDRKLCEEALERVTANNTTEFLESDLKTKDGKKIHVKGSFSCYYQGDELVAIRGFFEPKTAKPVKDNLSGIALERIFLEFHDKECSLAEPCFDDD
jgi:PAS domain S-box-containing protein